jgi:rhodanese-related sulfurtransferase
MKGVYRLVSLVLLSGVVGSVQAKEDSPKSIDGAKTVQAADVKKLWRQGVAIIDTRKDEDWEAGRIPGAYHVNIKKAEFNPERIGQFVGKNEPVVTYCNAKKCHRAANAAKKLVSFGYTQVHYFRGGFPAWKNAGYPYE